jgi:hypothetical protein
VCGEPNPASEEVLLQMLEVGFINLEAEPDQVALFEVDPVGEQLAQVLRGEDALDLAFY